MNTMYIGPHAIDDTHNCFVIAEIGNNHGGSIQTCRKMFKAAKEAGAHAVKLQKRDNRTLFTKAYFDRPYDNENSYGATYGEHREALEFGEKEYRELIDYAKELDIVFFATAFDIPSADFLESLDMPAYKVASADLKNTSLISHIATFRKPIILSTGGGTFDDITRALDVIDNKCSVGILHCVATYPNKTDELNLLVIKELAKRYPEAVIGYSNHHPAVFTNYAAYILGAKIIEVHFTLNRAGKGTDHAMSLEPKGLATLCEDLKRLRIALGMAEKVILPAERVAIEKMGKGIWPIREIRRGEPLTADNVALRSPGGGLPPYEYENLLGRISVNDLSTSEPLMDIPNVIKIQEA